MALVITLFFIAFDDEMAVIQCTCIGGNTGRGTTQANRVADGGRCDWLFGRHKSDECRHAGETGLYLRNPKGVGTFDKKVREVVIDLDVDAET